MDKEQLNWRSFVDAAEVKDNPQGTISAAWNLRGTPTLFVLDHEGVIRYRWLGSPGERAIDQAIETLIKEAQGK